MDKNELFEHISLQDRKSIRKYLKAVTDGVGNGVLSLADNDGEVTLSPDGLIRLNVRVHKEMDRRELHISLDWKEYDTQSGNNSGALVISTD